MINNHYYSITWSRTLPKQRKSQANAKTTPPGKYSYLIIASRLYVRGVFLQFRRAQRVQRERQAIIRIQGVADKKDTPYYHGKRVAYIFKAKTVKNGTKLRARWGKIVGSFGGSGCVRAVFQKNLPARAMGESVRVMLYPQHQ